MEERRKRSLVVKQPKNPIKVIPEIAQML